MTITEHKRLVAANIEDPIVGEWIEVSSDGERWYRGRFTVLTVNATYWIDTPGYDMSSWPYARRPAATQKTHECTSFTPYGNEVYCMCGTHYSRHAAAQKKQLRDEPWPNEKKWKWRAVDGSGEAFAYTMKAYVDLGVFMAQEREGSVMLNMGSGYDSTDWRNSLERRPE